MTIDAQERPLSDALEDSNEPKLDRNLIKRLISGFRHTESEIDAFLAHFGVKGMKWGVRRSDDQLDSASGGKKSSKPRTAAEEGFISEDARRIAATAQKDSHEMSTQEIKAANDRARAVSDYKKMFGTSDLDQQLHNLRTVKEIKQIQKELTPEKKSMVKQFTTGAAAGFAAFQQIDAAMQGNLSKGLSKKVGEGLGLPDPNAPKPKSPLDALKESNALTKERISSVSLNKQLQAVTPKPPTKPFNDLFAGAAVKDAKTAVQDAKDLNDIVHNYLQKPGTVAPTGPNLPQRGTADYGLSLITRQAAATRKADTS
jgi:hypothetical protein